MADQLNDETAIQEAVRERYAAAASRVSAGGASVRSPTSGERG